MSSLPLIIVNKGKSGVNKSQSSSKLDISSSQCAFNITKNILTFEISKKNQ